MGAPLRQPVSEHVRRPELSRDRPPRRDFREREAKRHLQEKETPWAPIAYGVFFGAVLIIACFAYTSYAFSKYRGEILPGTYVDRLNVSGMTEKQAESALTVQLAAIHQVPVELVYHKFTSKPSAEQLGLGYFIPATAKAAMQAGRTGSFLSQWLARMPFHPAHQVPLLYKGDDRLIREYVQRIAQDRNLYHGASNAQLAISASTGWHVTLMPAISGVQLDIAAADRAIHDALGSLSVQTEQLQVVHLLPAISDDAANRIRLQIENFLSHPPIIAVGRRVVLVTRADLGPAFTFTSVGGKGGATIQLTVKRNVLESYVASLAATTDRQAENAKLSFDAGKVHVISPLQDGRTLDQVDAVDKLAGAIQALKPNARLHFKVAVTPPPVDQSNPASLGIVAPLGMGASSFVGASPTRLADVTQIAKSLNNDLLPPETDISFNTLVGSGWLDRVYADGLQESGGQLVPAGSGAMQQVATTFLRALYASGLRLEERHAHNHRLTFYEPPVGLDAVVAPGRNWDLRFANSTHHYLLVETRIEPIRQELYIYVYGPKLRWHVSVDATGKVMKTYPHGPQIQRQDPSLAAGQVRQISWPLDGADVVIQRTITYPNGSVHTDHIATAYRPSPAIVTVGGAPTPAATPVTGQHGGTSATPTPTAPSPSPTPTFNH
jgi:vancomycin resistance protein YoaR